VKNKKGFTLFELLVSISIIGIMTALVVIYYSAAQKKTRDIRRIADIKAIQTAAEQFYTQNNYKYPNVLPPWIGGLGQTILAVYPTDPKDGHQYGYWQSSNLSSYCSCATLENASMGNASGGGARGATDVSCPIGTGVIGAYYCVRNQQ
jgi:prepilin-type N-terminal cleavage/methylation domain-containing protein